MKILVAIANYGTKNQHYLEKLLAEYRAMSFDVKVVVLSNILKDLGPGVEVIVGLPIKDPMSLPFGYKEVFAKWENEYDLFIYSEDDTLIEQQNIQAFLNATKILPADKIAGFLRYEIAPDGTKYYSTIHGHYHWDPNSLIKIGDHIFAHYTNDHSACFILTRPQLKKAIESGGFLLPPRKTRYGMLETAATDPYTQCGMKKLVCISRLDDFCLRHLPDIYLGRIGLDAREADREIEKLKTLPESTEIRGPLFDTCTRLDDASWDKKYYEPCRADILSLIPDSVSRVLSVGCGYGVTEGELVANGLEVVGIPMDCVIQVSAAAKGVKTLSPDFEAAKIALSGEQFDCILFADVVQFLHDPVPVIKDFLGFLKENGCIALSVPNFNHPSVLRKRLPGNFPLFGRRDRESFEKYGLHFTDRRLLESWLDQSGLRIVKSYRQVEARFEGISRLTLGRVNDLLQKNIVVLAARKHWS